MPNVRLTVAYDGTNYLGWQKTSTGPSIEESLQQVLEQILQKPILLQAASRTDVGVHAEGQIVNFVTDEIDISRLQYGCNSLLPTDIRVLGVQVAADTFHPTLDNIGKEYHYQICNSPVQMPHHRFYSWHVAKPLDVTSMQEAATLLTGEYNFQAFCNMRKNRVYSSFVRRVTGIELLTIPQGRLLISIRADQFLYKMARNIVGTLVYVGLGKLSPQDIPSILASQKRPQAGITAPPHGLYLKRVFY